MAYTPFQGVDVPGPTRDFVGYGRKVPKVRWPDDARVAVSIVLNYEEGSEYSHPNGDRRNDGLVEMIYGFDPQYRDLCVESVFEYGSRAGVWRLSREEEADHIRRAIASIEVACGVRPSGWYCRYGPSVNTRELLVEEGGFVYDSESLTEVWPEHRPLRPFFWMPDADVKKFGAPIPPAIR